MTQLRESFESRLLDQLEGLARAPPSRSPERPTAGSGSRSAPFEMPQVSSASWARPAFARRSTTCRRARRAASRFTPARARGKSTSRMRVGNGAATFTLEPGRLSTGQTLVITTSSGPAANRQPFNSLAIAIAEGKVAPCVPVKDTRPVPPQPSSGKKDEGPSLNKSFGSGRSLQQDGE
jgi:hypothetical protein